ncbi:MAG TPA: TonB-dependent receptor, partial [Planctomycetaceae bacterium]|nr:TonB-dependent receptor [Planctomycetaceae bacterium]
MEDPDVRSSVRQDYDTPIPSTSRGKIQSVYARDKFNLTNRWFIEGGLRFEKQNGSSDIGQVTVHSHDLSPRLSVSYDLAGNGKSIILGTAGRFYQFIIQDLSDRFNQFAPQSNYNNFNWDPATKQYVQAGRITASGNSFTPNTSLKPTYTTEVTLGFQ